MINTTDTQVPAVSFILRFLQGTGAHRIAALMPPVFVARTVRLSAGKGLKGKTLIFNRRVLSGSLV